MSSVGLSSSSLASLLGSSSSPSSNAINISSLLEVATGSSSEGIDVTAAVNAAVTAAEAPETQWRAQQTTLQGQENDLNTVNSQVTAVENDLGMLNSLMRSLMQLRSRTLRAVAAAPGLWRHSQWRESWSQRLRWRSTAA
jgi:Flagellar hook-associated protein 2 N-terminus